MTKKAIVSKNPRAITWTALDRPPAKRWWWYLGFLLVTSYVALCLGLTGQWTTLAALIAFVVAVLVVYRWPARKVQVELDDARLVVNGQVFPIDQFGSFRIDGEADQAAIVLVPKKRLALPVYLNLSGNDDADQELLERLEGLLPYFDTTLGFLDHLARWLRLR